MQKVLTLFRVTRKTTLNCMSALSVCLVPMFIAYNHTKNAHYVHMLLITLLNVSYTHRRFKELLKQNGFSVWQSLVLCLRNAFDKTIGQTTNPLPSQRRIYRLQQLELHFLLQMEWCITHHIRAQYVETNIQYTEMKYPICSDAKQREY